MKNEQRMFAAPVALLAWFAVIGQLYLIILNRTESVAETLVRYFSFFTILTNILVAICFTDISLYQKSNRFFLRAGTQAAITVYIVVVGATYNLLLRFLWKPQGLQRVVDESLHAAVPALVLIYWLVFAPKGGLKWKDSLVWMIYPLAYTILIIIRGAISDYYPYPFVDVTSLGYPRALLNGCVLMLAFMGLSLFLIAVAKYTSRKKATVS